MAIAGPNGKYFAKPFSPARGDIIANINPMKLDKAIKLVMPAGPTQMAKTENNLTSPIPKASLPLSLNANKDRRFNIRNTTTAVKRFKINCSGSQKIQNASPNNRTKALYRFGILRVSRSWKVIKISKKANPPLKAKIALGRFDVKIKVKYSMRQNNLIMRSLRNLGGNEGFSLITTALSLFILVSLYASITASFNSAFLGLVAQSKTQSNAFAQRAAFETLRPELLETLRFDRFNAKSHIEFIPTSNLGAQTQTIRAVPIEAKINLKLASTETVQKYLASYNVSRESVSDFLRLRQGSHDKALMLLQQVKGRDIWDHAIFSDNRSRPILANMDKNLIARISPILDATDIRTGGTIDGTIFIKFE